METLDRRIGEILEEGRRRAATILREQRGLIETMRDLLVEKKVIDATTLATLVKR
jgi:cell division protease FtsH